MPDDSGMTVPVDPAIVCPATRVRNRIGPPAPT